MSPPKKVRRNFLSRAAASLVSTLFALLLAEGLFRALLFWPVPGLAFLRQAYLYSPFPSAEFSILHHQFTKMAGIRTPPIPHPHPVVGWAGDFDPETYKHLDTPNVGKRRPVLLYGASFVACLYGKAFDPHSDGKCFQEYFNSQESFSRRCRLLNYGTVGYGLDQAMMLLERSADLYPRPYVVFSVSQNDLERALREFYGWKKPRFLVKDGRLVQGEPTIDDNDQNYFDTHPVKIVSYLYRLLIYGGRHAVLGRLPNAPEYEGEGKPLLRLLLERVIGDLRQRHLDFVFMVFAVPHPEDWRGQLLREVLREENVPMIDVQALLEKDMATAHLGYQDYFGPQEHPTNRQYDLIVKAMKPLLLQACGR